MGGATSKSETCRTGRSAEPASTSPKALISTAANGGLQPQAEMVAAGSTSEEALQALGAHLEDAIGGLMRLAK